MWVPCLSYSKYKKLKIIDLMCSLPTLLLLWQFWCCDLNLLFEGKKNLQLYLPTSQGQFHTNRNSLKERESRSESQLTSLLRRKEVQVASSLKPQVYVFQQYSIASRVLQKEIPEGKCEPSHPNSSFHEFFQCPVRLFSNQWNCQRVQ